MKLSELINKPVSMVTENGILQDIVYENDSGEKVLGMIRGKSSEDILVVYVDSNNKVKGVITAANIASVLEKMAGLDQSLKDLRVPSLNWDISKSIWLKKDDRIFLLLEKLEKSSSDVFIVVDNNDVYSAKIKRKNVVQTIRSLVD